MTKEEILLAAMLAIEPGLAAVYSHAELVAHALTLLNRLRIVGHIQAKEGDRE